jgi:predicted RNA-binding Zn ribbon-like protein
MSGVKMAFTHDTEVSLLGAAALVNTMAGSVPGDNDVDRLTTPDELDAFYGSWQWTGSRARGEKARTHELREVRALRPRLREVWFLDRDAAVEAVNALLRDGHALPQLVKHDAWDYHLHATPREAPLATRMAVEAAMALVDIIRAGELDRLKVCEADDCDDVLVDLSKNRSRRFCDGGCGNRANVAAYRARKAGTRS